jgi:RimJ/RimL family protein N-acetyltransferase
MKFNTKSISLKNGKKIILRSVTPDDSQNMLNHLRKAHNESYQNMNNSGEHWKKVSVEEEYKILSDFEVSKSNFMLVAVSENIIVGALGFRGAQAEFTKHNGMIGMSIQQEFTNTGLGTEMLKYAIELAGQFGFHRMELSVRTYNAAGIALYEKMGFQRIGLLKHIAYIDGKYVDEYAYQLILD